MLSKKTPVEERVNNRWKVLVNELATKYHR